MAKIEYEINGNTYQTTVDYIETYHQHGKLYGRLIKHGNTLRCVRGDKLTIILN